MVVGKIDFIYPSWYRSNPVNPTPIASIPGRFVIGCDIPPLTIKQDDDFFCNESQEVSIAIKYDSSISNCFLPLVETRGFNGSASNFDGLFSDQLNGDIVKIYDQNNVCVFDGVLLLAGRGFDPETGVIEFKIADLLRIFPLRGALPATSAGGATGVPVGMVPMTIVNFNSCIYRIFAEFGKTVQNGWSASPVVTGGDFTKMGLKSFYNSDINDVLATMYSPFNTDPDLYLNGTFRTAYKDEEGSPILNMFVLWPEGNQMRFKRFEVYHPWRINVAEWLAGTSVAQWITDLQNAGFYNIIDSRTATYNGVTYFVKNGNHELRLMGQSGSWQASNIKLKPETTNSDLVKIFLLFCGWKMYLNKNQLTIAPNIFPSTIPAGTALTTGQVAAFKPCTIEQYKPLDSSLFDLLDESETAKTAIKTAVEGRYNYYLPRITREAAIRVHSSAGITMPGVFITMPNIPGYPEQSEYARKWFIYETRRDGENPDWYDCKAYNIRSY